jgi:hypothetical protein
MIGGQQVQTLFAFAAELAAPDAAIAGAPAERKVQQLEDLFYCVHNAVRSAQLGHADRVPEGFHPVRDGGCIHERRHALTWTLSPGVDWDDTDLST